MALTITVDSVVVAGPQRISKGSITFDSSYPTGGEAITALQLGLSVVDDIYFAGLALGSVSSLNVGLGCLYDKTNAKIIVMEQGFRTGSTTAADSTSGSIVEDVGGTELTSDAAFRAMGTAIDTTVRTGGMRECGSTIDLSAFTVRYSAWGA